MITRRFFPAAPLFFTLFFFSSCASNEIGKSGDVNQEAIYQHYRFEYDGAAKEAFLFAQFRFAGEAGTTLVLDTPSRLEVDNRTVAVDSSDFSGAFYRQPISTAAVVGKHSLVFTDHTGKKYENHFSVDSFYLIDVPGKADKSAPLIIHFTASPLRSGDYIQLETKGADSSFSVKYTAADTTGYLIVPAAQLQRQKINELFLAATLYRQMDLQQQTREGGRLLTVQRLKPVSIKLVATAL